jgi:hypothetical protein
MARFAVSGMDELGDIFKNLAAIPDETIWAMLDAEADVVVAAQRRTAAAMLAGPYNKGAVKSAIRKGKIKRTKGVYRQHITFNGKQHGRPLGEIAFVNEFGKRGQGARPFVKTANEECADEAVNAAGDVYDNWIESL